MITPKEMADQLVKRFHPMTYTAVHEQDTTGEYADAIRCALIAVDEILKAVESDWGFMGVRQDYWREVKTELEKL